MKTIGIVGSRSRNSEADYHACVKEFQNIYKEGDEIVSGGCPKGGDRFAELIAKKYQIPIKIYYAQWNKIGKSAGFKRNLNIAEDCDILIAVVASNRQGGTEDTIQRVEKMNKKVILVRSENSISPSEVETIDID